MSDILHCDFCSFPNLPMCNWHAPQFYKMLESENAALNEKVCELDNINIEVCRQRDRFKTALALVEKKQPEVLAMLRKHGFVFDNKNGRWEKLAFTLYSDICELHSHAAAALAGEKEGK